MSKVYSSDFLVIGSGLSGQLFSLKAAKHGSVNLVTMVSSQILLQ